MTVDDYGFAPYVCDGTFRLSLRLGRTPAAGSLSATTRTTRESLRAYYEDLGEGSAALFSWVLRRARFSCNSTAKWTRRRLGSTKRPSPSAFELRCRSPLANPAGQREGVTTEKAVPGGMGVGGRPMGRALLNSPGGTPEWSPSRIPSRELPRR